MNHSTFRKYLAEFIGTFCLVFCGTGAIIIDQESGGVITHSGIAVTFGLIVLSMIYALGDISGAHINPAVTIAFTIANRFDIRQLLPYVGAQAAGGLLASYSLHLMFPYNAGLGGTSPSGSDLQSFILELILTFILMFVILNVSSGSKEKGITAGIAVASVVGLEAMFAGPISGASMNPVRSLAPAIVSGELSSIWVYMLAPVAGAILAVPVYNLVSEDRSN